MDVRFRLLLGVGVVLLGSPAAAVTRHVPSEYSTIQVAIDASAAGDTVLVAPGTYTDSETRDLGDMFDWTACVFMKDGVLVRSAGGPRVTTVDMQQAPGPQPNVILARFAGHYVLEGFTVTGVRLNYHGASVVGDVIFRDCVFRDMDAGASTGAGVAANAFLILERCEFVNCVADGGGAIYHANGRLEMYDCTVRECGSIAVLVRGNPGDPVESSHIEGCTFESCWGAALQIQEHHGGSTVRNCRFVGNSGVLSASPFFIGGWPPTPKVVEGCLFWNNSAPGPNGTAGGLKVSGPTIVRNNTFYGNTSTYSPSAVRFGDNSAGNELVNNVIVATGSTTTAVSGGSLLVSACNVFWDVPGGLGYTPGPTDRLVDPLFCDPAAGDFRVMVGSPCLPDGSIGCGLIGAFGEGCGVISVAPTSWGQVKAAYRGGEGGSR